MNRNMVRDPDYRVPRIVVAAAMLVILLPGAAWGYIGPGAGFAVAGSFLAVLWAVLSALSLILFWPFRRLLRILFRRRPPGKIRFKRVVILGLDGLDHGLTERFMAEGKLPHLAALRARGTSSRWRARCRRSRPSPGQRFRRA